MNRTSWLRVVSSALGVALISGCYAYVPTDVTEIQPSQVIRVQLTDAELTRLRAFADGRGGTVSGEFVSAGRDSVSLVVRTPLAYQQVAVPRSSIIEASVRRADPKRNLLVSAALVGAVGVAAYLGFEGRGGDKPGPGPQPDESLVPLFTFGLPLPFGR